MKKSIEEILNAARNQPVSPPFVHIVEATKERAALHAAQPRGFRRFRTFFSGVVVGILLASIGMGLFLRFAGAESFTALFDSPRYAAERQFSSLDSVRQVAPFMGIPFIATPFVSGVQKNQDDSQEKAAQEPSREQVRYRTRYIRIPAQALPTTAAPSWSELAFFWNRNLSLQSESLADEQRQANSIENLSIPTQQTAEDLAQSSVATKQTTSEHSPSQLFNQYPPNLLMQASGQGNTPSVPSMLANIAQTIVTIPLLVRESPFGRENGRKNTFENHSEDTELFSIGLRGSTTLYSGQPAFDTLKPNALPLPTAILSAHYFTSPTTAIGVEVGYDTYFIRQIESQTVTMNGTITEYENRYPTLFWAALYVQQRTELMPQMILLTQAGLGASQFGPIGRGLLGFLYAPDARTELLLGFEGSSIMFPDARGTGIGFSSKLGITYGVSVKF